MKSIRYLAEALLLVFLLAALWPGVLTKTPYDRQFRELPNAPVSRQFPLGTDELGRDRLSRLLYGTRVSLLAAPVAALLSMILAALVGGLAGFLGGWFDRAAVAAIDLMFARIVRAGCRTLRCSDLVVQARACGLGNGRVLVKHVLPNVRPILTAQFRASIPIYILAEANLGLLGLGVADPLPSWGNLLRPLESGLVPDWAAWAPLFLMLVVVSCLYLTQPSEVVVR